MQESPPRRVAPRLPWGERGYKNANAVTEDQASTQRTDEQQKIVQESPPREAVPSEAAAIRVEIDGWSPPQGKYASRPMMPSTLLNLRAEADMNLKDFFGESSRNTCDLLWNKVLTRMFEKPLDEDPLGFEATFRMCTNEGIVTTTQASQYQEMSAWYLSYAYTAWMDKQGGVKTSCKHKVVMIFTYGQLSRKMAYLPTTDPPQNNDKVHFEIMQAVEEWNNENLGNSLECCGTIAMVKQDFIHRTQAPLDVHCPS